MDELLAEWGSAFFFGRGDEPIGRLNYFSGAMQVSPGIFVHLDLCGDWLGLAGQSAFIALPLSPEVAWKRCEQHIAL
jgi:hypothetical protein